jgi:hypothetical protein
MNNYVEAAMTGRLAMYGQCARCGGNLTTDHQCGALDPAPSYGAQVAADIRGALREDLAGLADALNIELMRAACLTDEPEGTVTINLEISKTLAIRLDKSLRLARSMV